jgi:hypothetical protein
LVLEDRTHGDQDQAAVTAWAPISSRRPVRVIQLGTDVAHVRGQALRLKVERRARHDEHSRASIEQFVQAADRDSPFAARVAFNPGKDFDHRR